MWWLKHRLERRRLIRLAVVLAAASLTAGCFEPLYGTNATLGKQLNSVLKPDQWLKLISRLGRIENPTVPTQPSKYALKVPKRSSTAHVGE